MSAKSLCIELINTFSEEELNNILKLLQNIRTIADEAADDAYCQALLKESLKDKEQDDVISLEELASKLEINLDEI